MFGLGLGLFENARESCNVARSLAQFGHLDGEGSCMFFDVNLKSRILFFLPKIPESVRFEGGDRPRFIAVSAEPPKCISKKCCVEKMYFSWCLGFH